jgi:hypothetical protein
MSGSYVAARVDNFTKAQWDLFNKVVPLVGVKVPPNNLHVTILYSRVGIQEALAQGMFKGIKVPAAVKVVGASVFDSWIDNKVDPTRGTFVLNLESDLLQSMHQAFIDMGATHDYPSYNPHVTIFYDVPIEIAKDAAAQLNAMLEVDPLIIKLTEFYYEPLNEEWVSDNLEVREA